MGLLPVNPCVAPLLLGPCSAAPGPEAPRCWAPAGHGARLLPLQHSARPGLAESCTLQKVLLSFPVWDFLCCSLPLWWVLLGATRWLQGPGRGAAPLALGPGEGTVQQSSKLHPLHQHRAGHGCGEAWRRSGLHPHLAQHWVRSCWVPPWGRMLESQVWF